MQVEVLLATVTPGLVPTAKESYLNFFQEIPSPNYVVGNRRHVFARWGVSFVPFVFLLDLGTD